MKRWLSLLLVFAMVFSLCGGINLTAYAEEGSIEIADSSTVVSPETLDDIVDYEEPETASEPEAQGEIASGWTEEEAFSAGSIEQAPEEPDGGVIALDGEEAPTTEIPKPTGLTVLTFTSDTHNKSGNQAANRLGSWLDIVADKYGGITLMAFGGDMANASASQSDYWTLTKADMDQLDSRGVEGVYTTGNHEHSPGQYSASSTDASQQKFKITTEGAEGDNYRIFCLGSESSSSNYSNQISSLTSYLNRVGNDKPIFIITHFPLHYYGSSSSWWGGRTTTGAADVIDVLNNAVANNGQKIVFLWGHNHTESDTYYDYIYKPGDSFPTTNGGANKTIQFYYGAAGCMSDSEYGTGSASVKGKGLVVTINSKNQLSFTYYNASGADVSEGGTYTEQDAVAVTGITLNPTSTTVKERATVQLTATVSPSDATNKTVTWTSSNTSVATVDSTGKVRGVAQGTARITATTVDGGKTATCIVTVTAGDPFVGITYYLTDTLEAGKEYLIASGNTGSVYILSNEANGSRQLKGISVDVVGDTITIDDTDAEKVVFTAEANSSSAQNGIWLKNNGQYLYTNNANGLRMVESSEQGSSDNAAKSWHYRGDGKNLLWYFKDTASTDGYSDTSQTYKYYLEVSNGVFTDNHADYTSLANTNTPAMYLFVKGGGSSTPVAVTGVTLDKTSLALKPGRTDTLTATVAPGNASNKAVTWTSSNTAVATVSNGTVTAVAAGSTVITVRTADGGYTATCQVTVSEAATSGNVFILADSIVAGNDYLIVSTRTDGNAYALRNPGATASGASLAAAQVVISGGEIETEATDIVWTAGTRLSGFELLNGTNAILAGKGGTAMIYTLSNDPYADRCWSYDGSYLLYGGSNSSYTYELYYENGFTNRSFNTNDPSHPVYIFERLTQQIAVTGVTLDKTSLAVTTGKTGTLTATVTPSNATNKAVTWSSSNTAVATVDSNGKVTGVAQGTATITAASAENANIKATCTVTVSDPQPGAGTTYVLTDTLEAGKNYLIANGSTGSVYILSNEAGSSRQLKGVSVTVNGSTITIDDTIAAKAVFTAEANSSSAQNGIWLKNNGQYLYTNSANGLRMVESSEQGSSDNAAKSWHYRGDSKNLLWYFKDSSSTDGYSDTSQTYKYYLEVSNGVFTDNHASTTSLANTNTPKMYLFVEDETHTHAWGSPAWTWTTTATGYTASAAFTCTKCGETQTVTATVTSITSGGTTVYTATVTFNGETYTDTKTETSGVTYTFTGFTWTGSDAEGYTAAAANYRGSDGSTGTVNAVLTSSGTMATCETAGTMVYTASVTAASSLDKVAHTSTKVVEMQALGHDWSDWTQTVAPTCTAKGEETRVCSRCGATDTREIPALGHDLTAHAAVAATCEEDGNSAYWACSRCGKFFSDAAGRSEIAANSWVIPATGHVWSAPVWAWAEDCNSATATFTCGNDAAHVNTVEAEITKTPGTGDDAGYTVYTAIASDPDGRSWSDEKKEIERFIITCKLAGGELPEGKENPTEYTSLTPAFTLVNPVREGYTFAGWTGTDLEEATETVTIETGSTGNRVYTATWAANVYTIVYMANGGTGSMQNTFATYGRDVKLEANGFTRAGYDFTGWNTAADGSGESYADGATVKNLTISSSVNLYAQWEPKDGTPYTVEHYFERTQEGRYEVVSDPKKGVTDAIVTATPLTRTGFTFDADNENNVLEGVVTVDGNLVLKIYYTRNSYTVTFRDDDGTVLKSEEVKFEAMPACTEPSKPATETTVYTFTGWDPALAEVSGDATYTATYNSEAQTYVFDSWSWTGSDEEGWTAADAIFKAAIGTFSKTVKATVTKADGTGEDIGYTVYTATVNGPDDKEYTDTKKAINTYTITFNTDGGSAVDAITAAYGTAITAPADPTKEGFLFAGWDPEIPASMPAEDLTIMAKWTSLTYEVIPAKVELLPNATGTVAVKDSTGAVIPVVWTSNDETVATVDAKGRVTAHKAGYTMLTTTVEGEELTCEVQGLFVDVTNHDDFWFEPVYDLANRGIVKGWEENNTFRPMNNCNRAAMVTFLWRLSGEPKPETMAAFKDMPGNETFDKAISWAVENGIAGGYSDNTFRPWNPCNRAAFVTFLWRYAGKPEPKTSATFPDMTGSEEFDTAISWAVENGITTGYDDGTFRPWADCLRLAVVSFLYRYEHPDA